MSRYHFAREVKAIEDNARHMLIEHEVLTDVLCVGEFLLGHLRLTVWDIGEHRLRDSRVLNLRLAWIEQGDIKNDPGYFQGGGTAEEIVSLAAFQFRRRFSVGDAVRFGDDPKRIKMEHSVHPSLFEGNHNIGDLKESIEAASRLTPKYQLRFMLALRFYRLALDQMEVETEFAYLSLISAIEALSAESVIEGQVELPERHKALIQRVSDPALATDLETELAQYAVPTKKFVNFVMNHVDKKFWDSEERPKLEPSLVRPEMLRELLSRVYGARSEFLHSGVPLFPFAVMAYRGMEMPFGLSFGEGDRVWLPKEYIPHITFFERLVHHVLSEFLSRNRETEDE